MSCAPAPGADRRRSASSRSRRQTSWEHPRFGQVIVEICNGGGSTGGRMQLIRVWLSLVSLALSLSGLAMPRPTDAGQPEKLYRIGMLERTPTTINVANLE